MFASRKCFVSSSTALASSATLNCMKIIKKVVIDAMIWSRNNWAQKFDNILITWHWRYTGENYQRWKTHKLMCQTCDGVIGKRMFRLDMKPIERLITTSFTICYLLTSSASRPDSWTIGMLWSTAPHSPDVIFNRL